MRVTPTPRTPMQRTAPGCARNETVHRLSGILMAALGERVSAQHHEYMVGLIELIAATHSREELARWIAEAASR
jgi:hypothetical protein